ncbi:UDP-N-acetylmuramate dehydrogenase [Guggenheimella bovis]
MLNTIQKLNQNKLRYTEGELLKDHTSFQIGGKADIMIYPTSVEELKKALEILKEENVPFFVLGNGSNVLFSDDGYRGAVIKLGKNFSHYEIQGTTVFAESGALLSTVSKEASKLGLKGFEFATGIPGSIGGGVVMNAGAYDGELKNVITEVTVLTPELEVKTYTNEEMRFGYRMSRVIEDALIVLSMKAELTPGDPEEIMEKVRDFTERRTTKQPLELPSAGSTFKRPTGYFAGKLIEDSGLRGFRYRGAMVSEKHCGFVVNIDNATCEDVLTLIELIQKQVYKDSGVLLEPEVKLIGKKTC